MHIDSSIPLHVYLFSIVYIIIKVHLFMVESLLTGYYALLMQVWAGLGARLHDCTFMQHTLNFTGLPW